MAGDAVGRLQRVVIVDVAGSAGRRRGRHVGACQCKARHAVIERGAVPTLCCVAVCTISYGERWARGGVNRVIRLLPCGEVATRVATIRGCDVQTVIVIDMAGGAGNAGVAVRQRETKRGVIELSVGPRGNRMASGTSCGSRRETGLDVVGNVSAD